MPSEILFVPFHGQGHVFPSTELCLHLAARNYKITLVLPSSHVSSISASVVDHPLIDIAPLSAHGHGHQDHPFPPNPFTKESFADLLSRRSNDPDSTPPACAVVDVMMSWVLETCREFSVPTVSFFTSGACSGAMEHAVWKHGSNSKPGEILIFPGLPEDFSMTYSELTQPGGAPPPPPNHSTGGNPPPLHHQFGGGGDGGSGLPLPPPSHQFGGGHPLPPPSHQFGGGLPLPPPHPGPANRGGPPPWLTETEGSTALLVNTCADLEGPFLDYMKSVTGKPVWGVGPLLPAQFWGTIVHDAEMRSKRESNVSEDEVTGWLDSKPRGSVIYVAFGTEVGPSKAELKELAAALEESDTSFIWAIQSGAGRGPPPGPPPPQHDTPFPPLDGGDMKGDGEFFPEELARRAEGRGLIIRGWAPQLLILSHPSTAGFLSHCGWNSTMEALGRGVPLLAWPIRGDQHFNAKLVCKHLKVGLMVQEARDGPTKVRKDDIVGGIERLMGDDETRNRAASVRSIFGHGFPSSSSASLDAFKDFTKIKLTMLLFSK